MPFRSGAAIDLKNVRIIMICETPPADPDDTLYVNNTINAFNSAGVAVSNIYDIVSLGVYLTYAVPGLREGATVPLALIKQHSEMLEKELDAFPSIKAFLLMGDTAIKALNLISRRKYGRDAIPSGSTYKIRRDKHYYGKTRAFPSYLQTGRNFLIEKSKRTMVAEDIKDAFALLEGR